MRAARDARPAASTLAASGSSPRLAGPTVWLHGFASTPAALDGLRARVGGEAPMILGHGAIAPEVRTFEEEVDRLARHLPRAATLVGYSMGGRLALGLLARHPARVRGLVLIAAHPGLEDEDERATRREDDEARAQRIEREGLEAFLTTWDAQPLFARRSGPPPREGLTSAGLARALRVLGTGAMPSLWDALAAATVPIAYVVGDEDARYVAIADEVRARAPRVEVVVAPASDHDVLSNDPSLILEVRCRLHGRFEGAGAACEQDEPASEDIGTGGVSEDIGAGRAPDEARRQR